MRVFLRAADRASTTSASIAAVAVPNETAAIPGLFMIWVVVSAVLAMHTRVDPDLWGHLRIGLDVLRDGRLFVVDPYSFTQDRPFLDHEWGGEVLMALAWRGGGVPALVLFKTAIIASTLAILWFALRGVGTAPRIALLLLVAWAARPQTISFRPQLWSWLLVAATLALLPHRRARWAVPLLFAAWANLHGGWTVGLGALGVWACAANTRSAWLLWVVSAAATLANPYGVELWRFMLHTVRLGRDIREWRPIWTASVGSYVLPWLTGCGFLVYALWKRQLSPWVAIGCLGLAFASMRVLRLVPLFVMTVAIWTPRRHASPPPRMSWAEAVAAVVVLLAAVVPASREACWRVDGDWRPDTTVQLRATGTLLVPFGWGEYAIWRWGPRLRVSLDGRRETLYSDAVVAPQVALGRNDPSGLSWLSTIAPDVVWYPRDTTLVRNALAARGYRMLLETPRSYVLARPGVRASAWTRAEPKCFPAD